MIMERLLYDAEWNEDDQQNEDEHDSIIFSGLVAFP